MLLHFRYITSHDLLFLYYNCLTWTRHECLLFSVVWNLFKIRYAPMQHLRVVNIHHSHRSVDLGAKVTAFPYFLLQASSCNWRERYHIINEICWWFYPRLHLGVSSSACRILALSFQLGVVIELSDWLTVVMIHWALLRVVMKRVIVRNIVIHSIIILINSHRD